METQNNMTIYNDIQTSRCGWQWKDLGRFICLKIWPRLPKQSTRAIRISKQTGHPGSDVFLPPPPPPDSDDTAFYA